MCMPCALSTFQVDTARLLASQKSSKHRLIWPYQDRKPSASKASGRPGKAVTYLRYIFAPAFTRPYKVCGVWLLCHSAALKADAISYRMGAGTDAVLLLSASEVSQGLY